MEIYLIFNEIANENMYTIFEHEFPRNKFCPCNICTSQFLWREDFTCSSLDIIPLPCSTFAFYCEHLFLISLPSFLEKMISWYHFSYAGRFPKLWWALPLVGAVPVHQEGSREHGGGALERTIPAAILGEGLHFHRNKASAPFACLC